MNRKPKILDIEIQKFLFTGVIVKAVHEPGKYISSVFLRPKRGGSYRMNKNLSN
jgi:hypothetical protein